MRNFNFNHLYYFHNVARGGSLAEAASELNVTQSTISAQIKELESFLERRLFDRPRGGGLLLNDAGRRVFEQTTTMFSLSDQLLDSFLPQAGPPCKMLEVGVVSSASRVFAARFFLPLFRMKSVLPRLHSGDHDKLFTALITHDIDLLLSDVRPADGEVDDIEVKVVGEVDMVAVAASSLAARVKRFPEDVNGLPFVGYVATSPTRLDIAQWFHDHQLQPALVAETDDVNMMLEAARAGLCFAVLPRLVASRSLEEGQIKELGPVAHGVELCALYRTNGAAAVLDGVIAELIAGLQSA